MALDRLKGVGPKTLQTLNEAGLFHCEDLINCFPKRYETRYIEAFESLNDQGYHYIVVRVKTDAKITTIRRNMQLITFYGEADNQKHLFKAYNQRYLLRILKAGTTIVAYAKKHPTANEIIITKVMLKVNFKEGIHPIYNLDGISDKAFRKLIEQCLDQGLVAQDDLPDTLKSRHQLINRQSLYQTAHFPDTQAALDAVLKRLKYQELFMYLLMVQVQKWVRKTSQGQTKSWDSSKIQAFIDRLSFELTASQVKSLDEIRHDLSSPAIMHRMLQGDTGSGKTIIALIAAYMVLDSGYQVAFMAPTEILAEQHAQTFNRYLKPLGIQAVLLTRSTPDASTVLSELKAGTMPLVIGTHRLFSQDVTYKNLGLVITDEQHRFGVVARQKLKRKGFSPDVLYLSATPIPRTLAMTLLGDMDVSSITEKPKDRLKIETKVLTHKDKPIIRKTILSTLARHEQVYLVVPTIDDSSDEKRRGVKTVATAITARYPNARVAHLHARLKTAEKYNILQAFKNGDIDILVSTTVIEVGIDMPNATLMIIYHADRFGYAQLHQLRGRVGRSAKPSQCLLITETATPSERLKILETVHDGFELSEYDLKHRGFGDLLGTLQSGLNTFDYTDPSHDFDILKTVKSDAENIMNAYLESGEYADLIHQVKNTMSTLKSKEL